MFNNKNGDTCVVCACYDERYKKIDPPAESLVGKYAVSPVDGSDGIRAGVPYKIIRETRKGRLSGKHNITLERLGKYFYLFDCGAIDGNDWIIIEASDLPDKD